MSSIKLSDDGNIFLTQGQMYDHDLVAKRRVNVNFIPTETHAADILTNALTASARPDQS